MLNRKNSKKLGFTLIEMLIVIVIIGILAAYLIPRITGAQGKARDVARKADVNQVVSAIFSAQLDGKTISGANDKKWHCIGDLQSVLVKDGHYLSKLEKDPGGQKISESVLSDCDYYGYFIENGSIAVITKLEGQGGNANSGVLKDETFALIRSHSSNETGDYYVQIY